MGRIAKCDQIGFRVHGLEVTNSIVRIPVMIGSITVSTVTSVPIIVITTTMISSETQEKEQT